MATLLQESGIIANQYALARIKMALVRRAKEVIELPISPNTVKLKALAYRFRFEPNVTQTAAVLIPMIIQHAALASQLSNIVNPSLDGGTEATMDTAIMTAVTEAFAVYANSVISDKEAAAQYA